MKTEGDSFLVPGKPLVLPVIHVANRDQALANAKIAREAGADGIFLINHAIRAADLLAVHKDVFAEYSDWWVGVNCLDLSPVDVMDRVDNTVAGIWVDNAMIDEDEDEQRAADLVLEARKRTECTEIFAALSLSSVRSPLFGG